MVRRKKTDQEGLTDFELKIMNCVWELSGATVREVQQFLLQNHAMEYAYTTLSTVLRTLNAKGFLKIEAEGRNHRYIPSVEQAVYRKKALDGVVQSVFSGSTGSLLKCLVKGDLSSREVKEIQSLLQEVNPDD